MKYALISARKSFLRCLCLLNFTVYFRDQSESRRGSTENYISHKETSINKYCTLSLFDLFYKNVEGEKGAQFSISFENGIEIS